MARKLSLQTVKIADFPVPGQLGNFDYGDMMLAMLKFGPEGKGLSLDDILKAIDVAKPIETAVAAKEDEVTLSDTQWQCLRDKLNEFKFAFANKEIAEFGLMIRNAPEIGTEAVTELPAVRKRA